MPSACNVLSRTIFTGDNLDILRGINSECVDLIYLDHLLYYSRGTGRRWNADAVTIPKDAGELLKAYPAQDERGRYRPADLTGPRHNAKRGSPSTMPWKGYDVYAMNRVWSAPKTGKYAEYIEKNFIPGYREIEDIHDRLEALDNAGLIHHPRTGKWPGLKRYADADTGNPAQNLFLHPTGFTNFSTFYPQSHTLPEAGLSP